MGGTGMALVMALAFALLVGFEGFAQVSCPVGLQVPLPSSPTVITPDETPLIKVFKFGETEHSIFGQFFKSTKVTGNPVCIDSIIGDNALYMVYVSAKVNGVTYNQKLGTVYQRVFTPNSATNDPNPPPIVVR